MISKKATSNTSRKSARPKRLKIINASDSSRLSVRAVPVKRDPSRDNRGVALVAIWGDDDDSDEIPSGAGWKTAGRMPNPMPDDIVSLLKLAGEATWLTIPLAPYIYLLIKSWFEGRNTRKLKIKNGDVEIEFQGVWSERNFQKAFDRFRKMTKDLNEDDIQVIENGKVIRRGNAPAYKLTQTDLERARELEEKELPTKTPRKRKTKSKRK